MEKNVKTKKLGGKIWFNLILFGLMGQIAWNVENVYFNTFLCNFIYGNASGSAVSNSISVANAVAWMVALSAVTAVVTSFIMGNLSDGFLFPQVIFSGESLQAVSALFRLTILQNIFI